MTILNVYFIHALWLKDREKNIDGFKKIIKDYKFKNISKVNIEVIEDYEPDKLVTQDISKLIDYSQLPDNNKFNAFLKNIHLFQLSNSLKHYKALTEIKDNSNENDINLIVEDDILYEDKIALMLDRLTREEYIKELIYDNNNILFLGFPTNIKNADHKFQKTKEVFVNGIPYNDSYIISKKTASLLQENYLPIKFTNNIQLTYLLDKLEIESYLSIPNLFIDGTKFGSHLSVLTPNNILLFNNEYMVAKENIDTYDFTKETPLHNHPEFMCLKALQYRNKGKYKKAIELYDKALKIFKANNCIINNECEFLKEYICVYKYIDYNHF